MPNEKDDEALFRAAMSDVKPLQPSIAPIAPPKPPAQARFRRADEREVLHESLHLPEDAALLNTGDEIGFRRPQVPEAVLLKLRRGHYAVDAEIDLHGLNASQAKHALRDFIADSVARHMNCVRVIHGKGRRSGPRGPVLKAIVNHWLQRSNHVLAFGSARAVDGGSGALYVLLRH